MASQRLSRQLLANGGGELDEPASRFDSAVSFVDVPRADSLAWRAGEVGRGLLPGLVVLLLSAMPFATINAINSEIPLMLSSVYEHQNIASFIGTAYNVGNLVPFLYVLGRRWLPREKVVLGILMFFAIVPSAILSMFW